MVAITKGMMLFYTQNEYFGIDERYLEIGNTAVVFAGAPAPTAIRAMDNRRCRLVSNIFVSNTGLGKLFKDKQNVVTFTIE